MKHFFTALSEVQLFQSAKDLYYKHMTYKVNFFVCIEYFWNNQPSVFVTNLTFLNFALSKKKISMH